MRQFQSGFKQVPRAALFAVMALIMMLVAFLPLTHVEAEGGVSDLSLYQRASELTREFGTALAPGSGVKEEDLYMIQTNDGAKHVAAGNAGAFLGYADILADDEGIIGWLMNSYTGASATISYDQLTHVVDAKNDAYGNPFFQYAGYGEVLTEMGLANTIRPGGSMLRNMASGIVLIVYLLANAAPFLFRGALLLLTTLNPFQLFGTALTGAAAADMGMISGIADYLSDIYEAIQNLSLYVLLPMMLAVTIVSVLMFTKTSAMKKFSRYAVRVFMIFAGLPLIGATYTGVIEDMDAQVSVGSEYADYLILSSYVDFENWVKYSRLAPPDSSTDKSLEIRNPRIQKDETLSLSDRQMVLAINGTRANLGRADVLKERYKATSNISEIFEQGDTKKDGLDDKISAESKSSFSTIYNLLTRHMTSTIYTSSDYNGEVSGQIQKIRASASAEDEENIVKMFSLSSSENRTWSQKLLKGWSDEDWQKPIHWNGEEDGDSRDVKTSAIGLFTKGAAENELFQFGNYPMNIYNAGDLRYNEKGYESPASPRKVTAKTAPIGPDRDETVGGLSPIAMYNFLNTTFSETGLTVYSPEKSVTDISRDSYASVTFAGSGVSAGMRWVENVTVMFCLALLSIAFGFMMISVAITSLPRILSGVFGTALGSIAFITKLLVSTAVLLIQIIGIIFMYTLSENIIMTLLLNFNEIVDTGGEYFGSGVIFEFLGSFMVIVVTATVTIFMIRNVKIFKEMMEEVVSGAITRIMGALDTSTGGQGVDMATATGGRIGQNGRLTDEAKAADGAGPLGLGAIPGMAMLSQAHDLEARREQGMQERSDDGEHGLSKMQQAKARLRTASDLAGAKGKDLAKGVAGVEGKSYAREMDAKERAIKGDYNRDKPNDDPNNPKTSDDASGEKTVDENKSIDGSNGVAALGVLPNGKQVTDKDGNLLDKNGNPYTDENGNVFKQDERGRLIDEDGQFVALDKDGVLKPVGAIPGHNGQPVRATREASKLAATRSNEKANEAMKQAQNATHYGLNADGNAVDANGKELTTTDRNGEHPVTMDGAGFLTDSTGKRIDATKLNGDLDDRAFEQVVDPETGETHVRHKGDEAMKEMPAATGNAQSLTALARQSTKADAIAKNAKERAAELRANGAAPYAVAQAERFAEKAEQNAKNLRQNVSQQMQAGQNAASPVARQTVTPEIVKSAEQHVQAVQSRVQAEQQKLSELQAQGAAPDAIQRQARRVDAEQQQFAQAARVASDAKVAQATGRPLGEVSGATAKADRAANVFTAAHMQHQQAIAQKAPQQEIAKREQALTRASLAYSKAQNEVARVSAKPAASPQVIEQVQANMQMAEANFHKGTELVEALERLGSGEPVQYAREQEQHMAGVVQQSRGALQQAQNQLQQLETAGAPRTEVLAARKNVEKKKAHTQMVQRTHGELRRNVEKFEDAQKRHSPRQVQKAKQVEQQARNVYNQVKNQYRTVTSPEGWRDDTPMIQPVPETSPTKSYAELAAKGITSYDDYKANVQRAAQDVGQTKSQITQATARLESLRATNRPRQVVEVAERQVQELRQKAAQGEQQLASLRENAQGLLRNGTFTPNVVASRPIRKNGAQLSNELVTYGNTQSLVEQLTYQQQNGTITSAGEQQLQTLTQRLTGMRRNLVSAGIREDRLANSTLVRDTTRHLQQSWEAFVNGKGTE